MHALLTGATGSIGRALAAHLEARGWQVTRCVRAATGAAGEAVLPDLDPQGIAALPLDCDAVIHLAGIAHRYPPNVPPDAEYLRVNGEATGLLAQAARDRARTFVFVSSVAAVTSGSDEPIDAHTPPKPATAYGRSKLVGEQRARAALAEGRTSLRIVRLPAVYGPGAPGAVGQLAAWTARGRPVPSCAGQVRRSMIAMANAVHALEVAATHPALDGRVVMPADGSAPTVLEVAQLLAELQRVPLRVVPLPRALLRAAGALARALPGGGVPGLASIERLLTSCIVDDDTLHARTGWTPPCRMHEALRETLAADRRTVT
jgi:nucleoside-diphosphate-sugar epimerase